MAIDANIVLQGVVPDVGRAVGQGMQIGQSIRNAPLLRRLKKQQIAQGEQLGELRGQQIAQGELTQGQNEATTVFSIFGEQEITPENFGQATRVLQRQGVPLEEDDLINSPENVQTINQLRLQGKSFAQQGQRGASDKAVGGGDNVTRRVGKNEAGEDLFQVFKVVTSFGQEGAKREDIKLTEPFTKEQGNPLNTARGQRAEGEAFSKKVGEGKGGAKVKDVVADTEAFITSAKEGAKITAQQIGDLKNTEIGRLSSIKKAQSFKDALESGLRSSGVGRQASNFAPIGVWTDQGEFDELFNAFAEVAAREKLKASGEVRPTDADVKV